MYCCNLFYVFCFTDQFAVELVKFLKDLTFRFYKVGHFSPSGTISTLYFELDSLLRHTSSAKLFGVNSVEEYRKNLTEMPRRAERLFELFKDTNIDISFAVHNSNKKETFKLIAKSVLCRLGEVVLDLHQFSSVEEEEYMPVATSTVGSQTHNLSSKWLLGKKGLTWHGYLDARVRVYNNAIPLLAHELGNKSPREQLLLK